MHCHQIALMPHENARGMKVIRDVGDLHAHGQWISLHTFDMPGERFSRDTTMRERIDGRDEVLRTVSRAEVVEGARGILHDVVEDRNHAQLVGGHFHHHAEQVQDVRPAGIIGLPIMRRRRQDDCIV